MARRTVYCGRVSDEYLDQKVTLKGWVQKRRDLGGLIFIDLRDREGVVQVVFNPEESKRLGKLRINAAANLSLKLQGQLSVVIQVP